MVLFASPIKDLVAYRRNRFPTGTYLPLALFLCTAGLAGGRPKVAAEVAGRVLLACILLFQFRLWDDLADRERDRQEYPDRLPARARSLAPFCLLLIALFALNAGLVVLWGPACRLGVFLGLNGVFLLWYGVARKFGPGAVAGYHVTLGKYPVFVYLLSVPSAGPAGRLPYAMALVYLCFCAYEVLHDPRLRAAPRALSFLSLEMAGMAGVAALMAVDLRGPAGRAAALQGVLAVLGAGVLVFLFRRHRNGSIPGPACRAVFVVTLCWLLNFSLGEALP